MRLTSLAATIVLVVAGAAPGQTIREQFVETAKKIAAVVKNKGGALSLGTVEDASRNPANSGPGLLAVLEPLLVKEGVTINPEAGLLLKGEYGVKAFDGLLRVRLELRILDRSGEELVTLPERYEGLIVQNADIAILLGLTVHLPPAGSAEERNKRLRPFFDKDGPKPKPEVQDTIVRTQKGSPYGVEVRANAKAKAVRLENGHQPFVDIDVGDLYEIAILNDSGKEAAVRITIDGLDVFTFSEDRKDDGSPKFGTFIIPSGKTPTLIRGWHRTNKSDEELKKEGKEPGNIWKFLVTEYGKGSNSARKVSGKVGVITVAFSGSYLSEEERKREEGSGRDTRKETDQGPLDREKFVAVKRFVGVERDVISIRYSR